MCDINHNFVGISERRSCLIKRVNVTFMVLSNLTSTEPQVSRFYSAQKIVNYMAMPIVTQTREPLGLSSSESAWNSTRKSVEKACHDPFGKEGKAANQISGQQGAFPLSKSS